MAPTGLLRCSTGVLLSLLLLLAGRAIGGVPDPAQPEIFAILVGAGVYDDAEINLPGVGADIEDMRSLLVRSCGIPADRIVTVFPEVTFERWRTAIEQDLPARLDAEAPLPKKVLILLYYSGHGITLGDGRFVLFTQATPPPDTSVLRMPRSPEEQAEAKHQADLFIGNPAKPLAVTVEKLSSLLDTARDAVRARDAQPLVAVILDCCADRGRIKGVVPTHDVEALEARTDFFLAASGPGAVARERRFTPRLVERIRTGATGRERLTTFDIFRHLDRELQQDGMRPHGPRPNSTMGTRTFFDFESPPFVTIRAIDKFTKQAVRQATLELQGEASTLREQLPFHQVIPTGPYRVRVSAPDYRSANFERQIGPDDRHVVVELERVSTRVEGRLLTRDGTIPNDVEAVARPIGASGPTGAQFRLRSTVDVGGRLQLRLPSLDFKVYFVSGEDALPYRYGGTNWEAIDGIDLRGLPPTGPDALALGEITVQAPRDHRQYQDLRTSVFDAIRRADWDLMEASAVKAKEVAWPGMQATDALRWETDAVSKRCGEQIEEGNRLAGLRERERHEQDRLRELVGILASSGCTEYNHKHEAVLDRWKGEIDPAEKRAAAALAQQAEAATQGGLWGGIAALHLLWQAERLWPGLEGIPDLRGDAWEVLAKGGLRRLALFLAVTILYIAAGSILHVYAWLTRGGMVESRRAWLLVVLPCLVIDIVLLLWGGGANWAATGSFGIFVLGMLIWAAFLFCPPAEFQITERFDIDPRVSLLVIRGTAISAILLSAWLLI